MGYRERTSGSARLSGCVSCAGRWLATSDENAPSMHFCCVGLLTTHPMKLTLAIAMVQASALRASFDGVIEILPIRRLVDRTLPELPYMIKGIKGSLSIVDQKREGTITSDTLDLRDQQTVPFLDSQEAFGNVDIPGAFSDADLRIGSYYDTTQRELFYSADTLDEEIRSTLIAGFVSSSITYRAARTDNVRSTEIISRHGFTFSQNDNYTYDSIVFGGLKK